MSGHDAAPVADIDAERGVVTWWCSEPDGKPDEGCSIGLGNNQALWFGPMSYREGWVMSLLTEDEGGTHQEDLATFDGEEEALRFHYLLQSLLAPGGTRNPGGDGNG